MLNDSANKFDSGDKCPFNGTTTGNSTNRITGELQLESLNNERTNITIMLVYSSGIEVGLNDSIELSEDRVIQTLKALLAQVSFVV